MIILEPMRRPKTKLGLKPSVEMNKTFFPYYENKNGKQDIK